MPYRLRLIGRARKEIRRLPSELTARICDAIDAKTGRINSKPRRELITFVKDRPGHDRCYAIDASKIKKELGWVPTTPIAKGIDATIDWYLNNTAWIERVKSGEYREWIKTHYS